MVASSSISYYFESRQTPTPNPIPTPTKIAAPTPTPTPRVMPLPLIPTAPLSTTPASGSRYSLYISGAALWSVSIFVGSAGAGGEDPPPERVVFGVMISIGGVVRVSAWRVVGRSERRIDGEGGTHQGYVPVEVMVRLWGVMRFRLGY